MKNTETVMMWKCEHCGKPVPYPFYFCSECAEKLLGEPPKPLEPIKIKRKVRNKYGRYRVSY